MNHHTRTPTAPDLVETLGSLGTDWSSAAQQWWDRSQAAFEPWRRVWLDPAGGRDRGTHPHPDSGCGCHDTCGCADACRCCVPEADVVVHALAGEVRVVPFVLRNPWRRERPVTVTAGPWHVCGHGELDVRSALDGEESITLEPCETRVVRLIVSVAEVSECTSAYADVRFEGCARPQRVAVVVHPAACGAHDVPCDCGCC